MFCRKVIATCSKIIKQVTVVNRKSLVKISSYWDKVWYSIQQRYLITKYQMSYFLHLVWSWSSELIDFSTCSASHVFNWNFTFCWFICIYFESIFKRNHKIDENWYPTNIIFLAYPESLEKNKSKFKSLKKSKKKDFL